MIGADKAALVREVNQALGRELGGRTLPGPPSRVEPTLKETPRQRTLRLYPHLMPTRTQVEQAKRMALGSPGIEEKLTEIWNWAKGNWHWIGIGGTLYTILLIACTRRAK